jgi:hypothetical protein
MALQIRKATRRKAKLRLALIGPSGSGKTMSALKLAFGIGGKVGIIDTENGSADLYASLGDYDVITLEKPYTVGKYREAIAAFEGAGYDTIIVDSLSHAWAGAGGLLDKQGQIANRPGTNSYAAWREVTPDHNALVEALLSSRCHIIVTMRVKTEYVLETNDRGKQVPRKVGLAPVQRDGVEYEFTVVMDIDIDHKAAASKDRTTLFDGWRDTITEGTGRQLLQWLESGADEPAPAPAPAARPAEAPLPLIDPNAKEHAIATVELWHRAAMKAIGLLAHDPAALRAWADANLGAFGAVGERYPDTVKDIRAAISARLTEAVMAHVQENTEKEAAE